VAAFASLTVSAAAADAVSFRDLKHHAADVPALCQAPWHCRSTQHEPRRLTARTLLLPNKVPFCLRLQATANGLQLLPVGSQKGEATRVTHHVATTSGNTAAAVSS
jgi:hypothetical protein